MPVRCKQIILGLSLVRLTGPFRYLRKLIYNLKAKHRKSNVKILLIIKLLKKIITYYKVLIDVSLFQEQTTGIVNADKFSLFFNFSKLDTCNLPHINVSKQRYTNWVNRFTEIKLRALHTSDT